MSENSRLDQLLAYMKEDPNDSFILFAIAKEYEKEERWNKALSFYLDIKNKEPEYVGLYYHLGKLYELLDEPHLALEVFKDGIALTKQKKDLHALSELNNAKTNLELSINN